MNNFDKLNKKLNNYNNEKLNAIKNLYIGSATLLATTPICIYNMNIENLPIIIMTVLEIGAISIPIINIKNIVNSSKNIKLIKNKMKKKELSSKEIEQAYKIVQSNLDDKINDELQKGKRKKLIKLRNNISKYSTN